jgi:hypothetical protein
MKQQEPSEPEVHGLDDTAFDAIGKKLFIKTDYGWGWAKSNDNNPMPTKGFELVLDELWYYQNEVLRGGIGQVITEDHPYYGYWVLFDTRHKAHYNFIDKIGKYNIAVGKNRPTEVTEHGWPILGKDVVLVQGFGEVILAERNLKSE